MNKLTRIKLIGYIEEGDERSNPRITNNTKKLQESTIEHYIYQLFQTKLSEFRIKLTDRILPSLVNASKVNFI